jgi:hypothetical protein
MNVGISKINTPADKKRFPGWYRQKINRLLQKINGGCAWLYITISLRYHSPIKHFL